MNIFFYWDAGENDAPLVVRSCLNKWRDNFGDAIRFVSKVEAETIVSEHVASFNYLPKQVFADILRLALLYRYGGLWVDATVMPHNDIPRINDIIRLEDKVKVFNAPFGKRPCANWMISAPKGNRLIGAWLTFYAEYWCDFRLPASQAPLLTKIGFKATIAIEPSILVSPTWREVLRYFPYFACHYSLRHLTKKDPSLLSELKILPYDYDAVARALTNGDASCLPPLVKLSWRSKKIDSYLRIFSGEDIFVTT